jgi:xanthine dehydrogenase small subunit
MSLAAMVENKLRGDDRLDRAAVEQGISGNLCRCTGYRPIVDAGLQALAADHQSWLGASIDKTLLPAATTGVLLPATLAELAQYRQQFPQARLIAGGTDLMLEVTQQYRPIATLISLKSVAELHAIEMGGLIISIGAAATYREIELALGARSPQLVRLLHRLGSTQIRYQGTLGGNFGNGSPIADMPPAFMVFDAQLVLGNTSVSGAPVRRVPVEAFYQGYRDVDLGADEYIQAVELAAPGLDDFHRFYKNSKRIEDDISSVMGAFRFCGNPSQLSLARVAFGGMAATPVRMHELEDMLVSAPLSDALMDTVATALTHSLQPLTDVRASGAYRLAMAKQMLVRALLEYQGERYIDITEVA